MSNETEGIIFGKKSSITCVPIIRLVIMPLVIITSRGLCLYHVNVIQIASYRTESVFIIEGIKTLESFTSTNKRDRDVSATEIPLKRAIQTR